MAKRVTIKEVAQQAGVSYQTVSKVITGKAQVMPETEDRIRKAIHDLGYRPSHTARSLRSNRSCTLAYSWPPSPRDQANPILDQFLQSMFTEAEQHGYYLLTFPYHADPAERVAAYQDLIDTGRVDGFVISSVEYNDERVLCLLKNKIPFAAFGRSNPELAFPCIDVDGGAGLRMATRHLLEQGHRRIAALAWPEDSRVGNNRLEGYISAMNEAGIIPPPEWLVRGEGRVSFGFKATRHLLSQPAEERPTGLVCLNDAMAIGAMHAAQERGLRVGVDLAITGFDDAPMIQYLNPPLTSLRQPVWEIGRQLIQMLMDQLDTGEQPDPLCTLFQPELMVRASSTGQFAGFETV